MMYSLIRSIYRRVRSVPLLGSFAESVRYRRFPVFATARRRYTEQQALLEAHGHAIAGLRQALARHDITARDPGAELVRQVHHLNLRIDRQRTELEQRIEFARCEALFELRYRHTGDSAQVRAEPATTPRILDPAKLEAHERAGGVRLNVGCGHKPDANRLNVDMRELPGVDIVATVETLPFDPRSVQEIYSAHVLEHFPLEQLRRRILPAWTQLLRAGGQLRAVVPDAQAMLEAHARGEFDFEALRLVLFGGQEYEGDFHFNMFTPASLTDLLVEQGFVDIEIPARGRRNGDCLEFEIVGTKP